MALCPGISSSLEVEAAAEQLQPPAMMQVSQVEQVTATTAFV